ncbi:branched-chain amino acid transport system ATP-binding protein [Saccharomonospora amisosensis]|uniref:Branched-chain amino acid transport system ATP-binding protein n=1 Tax=Saccharomonospora amisosensis TaxID=1128677 RepID=A0A7X5ULW8_9PSEU|nr:ABC transporter ATP-binding protein [Saccharomonospora amisosensis]NIJ10429.1 branched-chain amino acid transport system ATP-binding protein [Saccharomonospora amisosensis]
MTTVPTDQRAPGAASTADPILELRGVDAFIGESHILHRVGFSVPSGEITALLGRNGAGKTTTLRSILGLVERRGTIRLEGHDVSGKAPHEVVRRGVGYVPENRDVFAGLTVAENLRLAERHGAGHRYDLVYELFPRLKERLTQRAGSMSGGEQQMLALARALLNDDNKLLLIDEPSQGLAPNLVREVAIALERMAELVTTVVVEQNLAVIRHMARRVVVLDQGRVVHQGPARELFEDERLTHELLGVARGGDR